MTTLSWGFQIGQKKWLFFICLSLSIIFSDYSNKQPGFGLRLLPGLRIGNLRLR
jgi:hypothetical protein